MSKSISDTKAALRQDLREKLRSLPAEEKALASEQISQRLRELPAWKAARAILCYVPTASEPDLWPMVVEALGHNKQVALPRYAVAGDEYVPCLIRETQADLEPGRYGILEPTQRCPVYDLKQLDFVLLPGIGFAFDGGRLGRGKGYYDRLLAGFSGFKCGVAFDCQMTDEFPLEPHDVRLNCILTPTRCFSVTGHARS